MRIGIIGVGNIGKIILNRLLRTRKVEKDDIIVNSRTKSKIEHLAKRGINIAKDNREVVEKADVIFLCVKPQDSGEMFRQIEGAAVDEKMFISTMVGVKIKDIAEKTGGKYITRIIPNVPAMIGKGIIPATFSRELMENDEKKQEIIWLLSSLGKVVVIPEKHMAAVTALSGSSPAFVFVVIEALIDAGIRLGLSYDLSRELVIETLKGSAELLQRKGNHPGEFRHIVTSPAGTTIEGIYSLEREGIRGTLMKTIYDTYQRAKHFEDGN